MLKTKPLLDLHGLVAKTLSDALQDDVEKFNPKIIEAAIRFLHNNGISAPPIDQVNEQGKLSLVKSLDTLGKLAEKFEDEDEIANVG